MHATNASADARGDRRWLAAIALVLALAYVIRAAPTSRVFTPEGVFLAADGDTYYHALRAERIAAAWPTVPWFDAGMNYPYGAEIPWPPLLDQLIATSAVATGPATPEHVARVAARVPPVLGVFLVAVTAALAWLLLGEGAWGAALLVAILPAAVRQSFVGRPDHHVLEVLLGAVALAALVAGTRRTRFLWWCALLAAAIALSFWSWSGSALSLALLGACAAALHLALPAGDPSPARAARLLALGAGGAAVALFATIAFWGPPGALASFRLTPITALCVAFCALAALAAGGIALARRIDPGAGVVRRAGHLAGIALLALGALAGLAAASRDGVAHGITALAASSPWYAAIGEFWPLVFSGRQPLTFELRLAAIAFGLTPLLLPFAAARLRRAWLRHPERRAELVVLAVWVAGTFALALARRRFEGYAVVPLAVAGAWVIRAGVDAARPRLPRGPFAPAVLAVAAIAVVAAPGLPVSLTGAVVEPPDGAADKVPLLSWLATVAPFPGREGVLSTWTHGHEIQWMARKPVVSTPFGTDIDPRSLQDEAAFFTTLDPAGAQSLLARRKTGFLLLENPVREVATLFSVAPGAPELAIEELGFGTGSRYAMHPAFFDLVASRLYFFDGGSGDERAPALADYRLLAEGTTVTDVLGMKAMRFKLFGVVEGARLKVRGATPGALVRATAEVRTNAERVFAWAGSGVADSAGSVELRLPYATGINGLVRAGRYLVGDGAHEALLDVREADVVGGGTLETDLGG